MAVVRVCGFRAVTSGFWWSVLALAMMVWSTRYYINVPFPTRLPTLFFFIAAIVAFVYSFSPQKASAPHPM